MYKTNCPPLADDTPRCAQATSRSIPLLKDLCVPRDNLEGPVKAVLVPCCLALLIATVPGGVEAKPRGRGFKELGKIVVDAFIGGTKPLARGFGSGVGKSTTRHVMRWCSYSDKQRLARHRANPNVYPRPIGVAENCLKSASSEEPPAHQVQKPFEAPSHSKEVDLEIFKERALRSLSKIREIP